MNKSSVKLAEWMKAMEYSDKQLADAIQIDRTYIWRMRTGELPVSDSFAWKFAEVYGYDVAHRLFGRREVA